ncbi:MAG: ABC transporter substrate-binding protein [Clostridia bacterium]|nr:ABC transporter substrate-binding protein [Clostridia bacterium]
MKRILIMLLLLCLLAGCGASGGGNEETAGEQQSLLLGFSQLGWESAWRLANTESIKSAAEEAGVSLMYENAEQKQDRQIKAIRSFIAYQVDVIAFSPIVENGWDNVLQEAKDAGIPVLTTDRMIHTEDESLYAGFIGSDFRQEGVSSGEFLIEKMKRDGLTDLNIVELSGTIDSTPMLQRAEGFREAIAGVEGLTLIDSMSGDFLRPKGRECMKALLEKHEKIDVLYSHNDAMTLGAISAMEEAGIEPGKDIIIITVDGEQAAVDLLKEGKVNCVVECKPQIGETVMELAKKLAAGEKIPRNTYSEEQVFTEFDENLDAIAPRGY